MTGFTFTAEQIRSAPPEVRLWVENEIANAFRALANQSPAPEHSAELAACTSEEALQVFELIRGDFATTQVFVELARQDSVARSAAPLHALSIDELKRRLRFSDDRLVDGLRLINLAFQQVRNDPAAPLFGFDQANHVYIHETTHRNIRRLLEQLTQVRPPEATASTLPAFGFVPPHVGPSEDIATH
jgi:hypothetical protein